MFRRMSDIPACKRRAADGGCGRGIGRFDTGPHLRWRLRMGGVGDKRRDFKIA
jgi:hypothetical protein